MCEHTSWHILNEQARFLGCLDTPWLLLVLSWWAGWMKDSASQSRRTPGDAEFMVADKKPGAL